MDPRLREDDGLGFYSYFSSHTTNKPANNPPLFWQEEQKERKLLWIPVFLGLALWTYFSYIDYNAPWFIQRKYKNYKVSGTIVDIEEFEKRQRITLQGPKRTLKLSVPNKYPLRLYDQISGKADLTSMGEPSTPYSYDVRKDAYFRGIASYGRMHWLHIEKRGPWSLRQYLNNQMKMHIKDPAAYGLAKAIVLGDKAGINLEIKNAFSVSGISHLLAISGLHLMLFAGVIFFVLRMALCLIPGMALRYNTKKAAAVLALCFAITYMVVSGYGYPVVRATIMFGLIMAGHHIGPHVYVHAFCGYCGHYYSYCNAAKCFIHQLFTVFCGRDWLDCFL